MELADPAPNGLAELLAGLLASNLDRRPDRGRLLGPSVVELHAPDVDATAYVRLRGDGVTVGNGGAPRADLRIRGGANELLALAAAPLRFGLPDPLRSEGRDALRSLAGGRVRVSGVLRHPLLLSRFARLLSAH